MRKRRKRKEEMRKRRKRRKEEEEEEEEEGGEEEEEVEEGDTVDPYGPSSFRNHYAGVSGISASVDRIKPIRAQAPGRQSPRGGIDGGRDSG